MVPLCLYMLRNFSGLVWVALIGSVNDVRELCDS